MSSLHALRAATTRNDLAVLLGYKPSALSFIVYLTPPTAKYTTFDIAKKGGGTRRIDAPTPRLKGLQKRLADLLYECLREIEESEPRKNKLSHAYRKQFSIITNAKSHKSRRYVLNLDLEGFFPSLNFGRVRGFFLTNNHFKLARPIATLIAQIACNNGTLPQGSPCSPIISELLTHFLDMRLVRLAGRNKCSYTRYADDITFSTNQKEFPEALAVAVAEGWSLGDELRSRIEDAGFSINESKTRMQVRGSCQTVTGLTVNEKVNVPQRYYKLARAMTHSLLSTGSYLRDGISETSVQRLEGILDYIYNIRERQIDIALSAEKDAAKRKKLLSDRVEHTNEYPSAIRKIYYRLVFFKHFVDPTKPLIICEGPTDPVYLKSAIRRLASAHPKLTSVRGSDILLNVAFFKYSKQSRDLLQMRGGSGDLKYFLEGWKEELARHKHRPMKHPIIVLIDNDDGAKSIFGILRGKFGQSIGLATDLPFYHLDGPLYLVKTPTRGADHKSCPEDFFESHVLATKVDGKIFNPDKEHDAPGEYGKVIFAEKVIRPLAGSIDFSGFEPLLARIEAVIEDYSKRTATRPPPPLAAVRPTASRAKRAVVAAKP
ncbi:RNA-directed DNA polymerase [Bradyrhizobium sp. Rc3b]|uniref:retron Ec67 family RNA-directed DNA polymerase/endonuclease n=1 Tax=Bradyrhizobium sp. Rc3b TaxID=1855322 RepID=UPI0008EEEB69|nr:retron Ec67 family RNA-directed DNA polymerase/endonuclease [Bradyrhizobium sp. Rc3b]SFN74676.1 RNA-directed DNA polymerase [Bradyrhizobium sp. Rc3b]